MRDKIEPIARVIGALVMAALGWQLGIYLQEWSTLPSLQGLFALLGPTISLIIPYVLGLVGGILGLAFTPHVTTRPFFWVRDRIREATAHTIVAGIIGLIVGLILSALLSLPLSLLPYPLGRILPFVAAVVFGYLGTTTMMSRGREILGLVGIRLSYEGGRERGDIILLDTSVIIDGRIADISQTGFIRGTLIVPRFVLNELQHIADSPDILRRNRGRRGLEILNRMQKDHAVPVQISDMDAKEIREVDSKLVKLARDLKCPILTNDFNLIKIAELQGVEVLNINALANAVKSVVLPGETISIQVIQEGKELGQGVGYLDDGTMVVVEDGRRYIGETIEVTVTRVLQTMAGRMIFAQPEAKTGH